LTYSDCHIIISASDGSARTGPKEPGRDSICGSQPRR
jgi:hypothetical protein